MKRVVCCILLLFLVGYVSAATTAAATAQQINTLLDKKTPYTLELTQAQMNAIDANFDAANLTHPGKYKIVVKSATYNAAEETAILYIQAWRDDGTGYKSIATNSPYHFHLDWSGGIHGATAAKQLSNFGLVVVRLMDSLPNGNPINDDTFVATVATVGGGGHMREYTPAGVFTTINAGGGDGVYTSGATAYAGMITASTTADQFGNSYRMGLTFNTSAIPDDATITGGNVSVIYAGKANGLGSPNFVLTGASPENSYSWAAGDFDSNGTEIADRVAYASFAAGTIVYTGNSAWNSYISKTGNTSVMFMLSWQMDNYFGGTWSSSQVSHGSIKAFNDATESNRPLMYVIYTPAAGGDTTPPLSLSGFSNTTTCTITNISFSKPADSDYDGFKAWWNNAAESNQTNATTWYNKSGLSSNTQYTLSTKTFDLTGNLNATFVNYTITTVDCVPPSAVSGLASSNVTCNSADVSWTNPTDADLDYIGVLINGTWTNQTNGTTFLSLTGLPELSAMTLNVTTVDLRGNQNLTHWQNISFDTIECPDVTPPDSITDLTNLSTSCSSMFFNWTNPADADYGNLMIWRNDTALSNLTNTTTGVSWIGLPESTDITFSSKTCDLVGNCNATFVNMTHNTGACGVAPVAAFSANNLSSCSDVPIVFTDASANVPTSWKWTYKNATVGWTQFSTSQNIAQAFPTGNYSINLTATNAYGSDDEEKTDYLVVSECIPPTPPSVALTAAFTHNVTCGNVPFAVMFNDTSTGTGITTYYYDFGDGNTSASEDDINIYSVPGLYTVRHSVDDGIGNVSWDNQTGAIRAVPDWITCAAASGAGGTGGYTGSEAIGALFGIIGGMIGAIVVFRRKDIT